MGAVFNPISPKNLLKPWESLNPANLWKPIGQGINMMGDQDGANSDGQNTGKRKSAPKAAASMLNTGTAPGTKTLLGGTA